MKTYQYKSTFRWQTFVIAWAFAALFSCGGRSGQHYGEEEYTDSPAQEPTVEEVEIVFDEEEGEASLVRNFYFIFDASGSMEDVCSGKRKIEGAKEAVNSFLTKVPKEANLGLLVFDGSDNEGFREVVPIGPGNRERFRNEINAVAANGGTPLAEAMHFGVDRMITQYKKQLGYGEYRLIIVTDGEADHIPKAARYALKYKIPIYAIGLCMDNLHPLKNYALSYREANNYEDLAKALEETVAEAEYFDATEFN